VTELVEGKDIGVPLVKPKTQTVPSEEESSEQVKEDEKKTGDDPLPV
jgi:hypothetical protein